MGSSRDRDDLVNANKKRLSIQAAHDILEQYVVTNETGEKRKMIGR
jgi:hypothetical protein